MHACTNLSIAVHEAAESRHRLISRVGTGDDSWEGPLVQRVTAILQFHSEGGLVQPSTKLVHATLEGRGLVYASHTQLWREGAIKSP